MNTENETIVNSFDLVDAPVEEQEEFFEDIGEMVMQSILQRAWAELSTVKRDELTILLEASEADPENDEKQQAVLAFLDENVSNIEELIKEKISELEGTYREYRDEMLDAVA